jgi:hypothetical protein
MLTYLKIWLAPLPEREKGSVTIENIVWAIAVIAIAAIVIAAITGYVTSHSTELLGP